MWLIFNDSELGTVVDPKVLPGTGEESMASPSVALRRTEVIADSGVRAHPLDLWMLAGVAIAILATIAGMAFTRVKLAYFFQPTGALIVLGGTLGVTLMTAPRLSLLRSARRVVGLLRPQTVSREALVEEMIGYAKTARKEGMLSIEPLMAGASHPFLRDLMALAIDVKNRAEFQATIEAKVRLRERQGEADAKALEIAGGFAPTIGVLGTVVGLIDVLQRFSDPSTIAVGIGTAFVSTIYGLGLANLVLLPAACRIRANVAEVFELEEMMLEGGLGLFDGPHPALLRERLRGYLDPYPQPAERA
jgi:chemotaxis protein MotA